MINDTKLLFHTVITRYINNFCNKLYTLKIDLNCHCQLKLDLKQMKQYESNKATP